MNDFIPFIAKFQHMENCPVLSNPLLNKPVDGWQGNRPKPWSSKGTPARPEASAAPEGWAGRLIARLCSRSTERDPLGWYLGNCVIVIAAGDSEAHKSQNHQTREQQI